MLQQAREGNCKKTVVYTSSLHVLLLVFVQLQKNKQRPSSQPHEYHNTTREMSSHENEREEEEQVNSDEEVMVHEKVPDETVGDISGGSGNGNGGDSNEEEEEEFQQVINQCNLLYEQALESKRKGMMTQFTHTHSTSILTLSVLFVPYLSLLLLLTLSFDI